MEPDAGVSCFRKEAGFLISAMGIAPQWFLDGYAATVGQECAGHNPGIIRGMKAKKDHAKKAWSGKTKLE